MISKSGQDCPLDGAEPAMLYCARMRMWWNGRHRGLKIPCPQKRVGSSPTIRTALKLLEFRAFLKT